MKKYILPIAISIFSACSTIKYTTLQEAKTPKSDIYIKHSTYSLAFNQQTKQADWVAYKLTKYQLEKNYKRKNNFKPDTTMGIITATKYDYKKSGYDRGHLIPAADRTWDDKALDETFYFSNISPQLPKFNRGIWKNLEEQVRKWAENYDSIYICTGPVFENTNTSIGNKVTVPSHFYKTILVYNDTAKQAIGFLFPHDNIKGDYNEYSTTIDSIEQILNIDLYYTIPNRIEKNIENKVDINFWK